MHQHIIVNVMNVVVRFHVILHNVQLVIHIQSARVATTVDTTIVYVQIVDIVVLADALVILLLEIHHATAVAEQEDAMIRT